MSRLGFWFLPTGNEEQAAAGAQVMIADEFISRLQDPSIAFPMEDPTTGQPGIFFVSQLMLSPNVVDMLEKLGIDIQDVQEASGRMVKSGMHAGEKLRAMVRKEVETVKQKEAARLMKTASTMAGFLGQVHPRPANIAKAVLSMRSMREATRKIRQAEDAFDPSVARAHIRQAMNLAADAMEKAIASQMPAMIDVARTVADDAVQAMRTAGERQARMYPPLALTGLGFLGASVFEFQKANNLMKQVADLRSAAARAALTISDPFSRAEELDAITDHLDEIITVQALDLADERLRDMVVEKAEEARKEAGLELHSADAADELRRRLQLSGALYGFML